MLNMDYSERGSEWRKWDLHLHSPSSYDYEDKSLSNENIIRTLKDNGISAAVITDHIYIDVKKIKKLIELGEKENILILPGIEFKSRCGGKASVHFIGILDNKDIKSNWERIKGELKLTKRDIEEANGCRSISTDIQKACNLIHELGGITTVHAGKKSNSLENISSKYIYKNFFKGKLLSKYIDILEIGKKKDIEDYIDIIFPNTGLIAPLIMASDNHNINDYKLKENCWIKADLTFEGLKQIIYEPEERVKIQENKPDYKNDYEVIDSITFFDDDFMDSEIKFNSNLVSIIGGKSTGKSTFLRSIVNAVNPNEAKKDKNWENLINPDVIVKWKSGRKNCFDGDHETKIKYIPQNFLNNQVIDMEDKDSFSNDLIKSILIEDEKYRLILDKITNINNHYENELHEKITNLFDIQNKIDYEFDFIRELGNQEDIKQEVDKLTLEYEKIQKSASIGEDDKKLQKTLISEMQKLDSKIWENEKNYGILQNAIEELENHISSKNHDLLDDLPIDIQEDINEEIYHSDMIRNQMIKNKIQNHVILNLDERESLNREHDELDYQLNSLDERINLSDYGKEVFNNLNDQKKKLDDLNNRKKTFETLKTSYEEILNNIFSSNAFFIKNLKNTINEFVFIDETEIFIAECGFRTKDFNNDIGKLLNNRKFSTFEKETGIDLYNFEADKDFNDNLRMIIEGILKESLIPKTGKKKSEILLKILSPYHFLNFNIVDEGDTLERMSPGKKSFIILKVLIKLDNSKWPILIDQPEDDLDANSVSKLLSQFLKDTKKDRQIIIVTHNPNLAVGADSEQIIVANQEGIDSKNASSRFEFMSGSIENTYKDENEECYLYCKGIKEHICDILEGGEESFKKRQAKYNIK
nr:hypothetical protein [Methanobrevibacter arboriphilus]